MHIHIYICSLVIAVSKPFCKFVIFTDKHLFGCVRPNFTKFILICFLLFGLFNYTAIVCNLQILLALNFFSFKIGVLRKQVTFPRTSPWRNVQSCSKLKFPQPTLVAGLLGAMGRRQPRQSSHHHGKGPACVHLWLLVTKLFRLI